MFPNPNYFQVTFNWIVLPYPMQYGGLALERLPRQAVLLLGEPVALQPRVDRVQQPDLRRRRRRPPRLLPPLLLARAARGVAGTAGGPVHDLVVKLCHSDLVKTNLD